MLIQNTNFLKNEYRAALLRCMLSILSGCLNILADGVLVGQQIGQAVMRLMRITAVFSISGCLFNKLKPVVRLLTSWTHIDVSYALAFFFLIKNVSACFASVNCHNMTSFASHPSASLTPSPNGRRHYRLFSAFNTPSTESFFRLFSTFNTPSTEGFFTG